ncbi:MAG: hypothetical protein INR70_40965 [Parafilimonas terrae]|nr:hypothetical protein [Parafilimonas terrae]
MSDQDAHVHKITALTIDDLRTSGAQTPTEIRAALRVSLYSLNGDEALPALIARLMPTGIVQRPKIIVQR